MGIGFLPHMRDKREVHRKPTQSLQQMPQRSGCVQQFYLIRRSIAACLQAGMDEETAMLHLKLNMTTRKLQDHFASRGGYDCCHALASMIWVNVAHMQA